MINLFGKKESGQIHPLDVVEGYLHEHEINFERTETNAENEMITFGVAGEDGINFNCIALHDEERESAIFMSISRNNIPEKKRIDVCEFIVRYNYAAGVSHLEMDMNDGEIRFVTKSDFQGSHMSAQMAEHLIAGNLVNVENCLQQIMKIVYGGLSGGEAFANWMGDDDSEAPETTRADSEDVGAAAFETLLLRVLGLMALADGTVSQVEVEEIRKIYNRKFAKELREERLMRELEWLIDNHDGVWDYLKDECKELPSKIKDYIVICFNLIAKADDDITESEKEMAARIRDVANITDDDIRVMRNGS